MSYSLKFYSTYLNNFDTDLKQSLRGFNKEEQIELINFLLDVLKCYQQVTPDYEKADELNEAIYRKYRNRMVEFSNIGVIEYYHLKSHKHLDLQFALAIPNAGHEDNYFPIETHMRFLTDLEMLLKNFRHFTYLTTVQPESEEAWLKDSKPKTRGRLKREREDGITALNQEQTALLIYCMRMNKIILHEDYLSNTEVGQAFSLLTGYSADTIRQNLNKSELARIATKKNAETIEKVLKSTLKFVENDIMPEG